MQIKNIKIFDSTAPADGAWIDVSNLVSLSVHLTGVEAKTWIEVSNDPNVNIDAPGTNVSAPSTPVLSQGAAAFGGLKSQGTYYVKLTYVTPWGETTASSESSLAVSDGNVLTVMSPGPDATGLATGYNVYISKSNGAEVLQTGPAYVPAHTVDSTPGIHFAISGAIPLNQNFSLPNGFFNSGIVVPSSNTAGGVNVGVNVLGTSGDFSTASQTDAAITIFVDTNNKQVMWSPSGMNWKWLRVRKGVASPPTGSVETIAWLEGQNG